MKKDGFTIIETVIIMGILSIVIMIFSPLLKNFIGLESYMEKQSEIDRRPREVIEIIKRDVKNSRKNSKLNNCSILVLDNDNKLLNGEKGKKVIIYTETIDNKLLYVIYEIKEDYLVVNTSENYTEESGSTAILRGIDEGYFRYKDNILLIYIKLSEELLQGEFLNNEIREVAIVVP
jgi:Tfp pilus assembly major pilin PilA